MKPLCALGMRLYMVPPRWGDFIGFSLAAEFCLRETKGLQLAQRRIQHTRTWAVIAVRDIVQAFYKLVAMRGHTIQQAKQHQLQLFGIEFASARQAIATAVDRKSVG